MNMTPDQMKAYFRKPELKIMKEGAKKQCKTQARDNVIAILSDLNCVLIIFKSLYSTTSFCKKIKGGCALYILFMLSSKFFPSNLTILHTSGGESTHLRLML